MYGLAVMLSISTQTTSKNIDEIIYFCTSDGSFRTSSLLYSPNIQICRLMESANTKTFLILQAHFSRLQLPCSDYYTDTKSVLDQTIRILQAMIDVCAENGWLASTLRIIQLMQMVSFV